MRLKSLPLLLLFASLAAASTPNQTAEANFAPGGSVTLDLRAGDYTIQAGANDKIVIRYSARDARAMDRVITKIKTSGTKADVYVNPPDNSNFSAVIELPAHSDIDLRLTAGDLKITGLEGNKQVSVRAGDIDVYLGRPEDYGEVRAHATAGDITSDVFHGSESGVFRSFHHQGPGKYRLDVSVWAGDITLH